MIGNGFIKCFIALLVTALVAAAAVGAEPRLLNATIKISETPGEPGAPTQTLIAVRNGAQCHLTVRIGPADAIKAEKTETRPISIVEFDTLWSVVVAEKVRGWLPEESLDEVADFGEKRIRVEWTTEASGTPQVHEVAWVRPVTNGQSLVKTRAAMSTLIRAHIRDVKLFAP